MLQSRVLGNTIQVIYQGLTVLLSWSDQSWLLPPSSPNISQDFGEEGTTHGIKYILQRDQPIVHRVLWLIVVLSGVRLVGWRGGKGVVGWCLTSYYSISIYI